MRLDFWDVLLAHVGSSSVRLFFFGAGRRTWVLQVWTWRDASFVDLCGVRCGLGTLVVEAGLHRPRTNVTQVILGVLVSRS